MGFSRLINIRHPALWAALALAAVSSGVLFLRRHEVSSSSAIVAIGLRGTSRVTRPLSSFQKKKLEKHFLETPPVPHAPSAGNDVRTQVNALNEFNKRQRP